MADAGATLHTVKDIKKLKSMMTHFNLADGTRTSNVALKWCNTEI